jgi:eukaryotic-like serine/threonine-protein kinase
VTESTSSEDDLLRALAHAPDVVPVDHLVGTRLGRYLVRDVLGRGGMGVVYRARDETLERDVALKLVPQHLLVDPERRHRFVREARSAAAAAHANIASIYDVGEIEGHVFIAMELVEGESLRARLGEKKMARDDAIVIARGIARGLAKAHEKGIVHRDLKPENVMVSETLDVKVLDFGLAKWRDDASPEATVTHEGRVLGTPAYMSPEQAKGKPVDARTDVFAFGVVFYEMLSGVRPFTGDSAVEILAAITRDDPPPIDVPASLRSVLDRCLAKDPDARFSSAKELLAALESLPSFGAPRRLSMVVVAGALVLVALSLVFLRVKHAPRPPAQMAAQTETFHGVAITDHPRPRTSHAGALAAYDAGLQNFRDGSIAFAVHELDRAATLDPALAAAHVRLLLLGSFKLEASAAREHYAAALQHRAFLDVRDAALLSAAEELIRERPDVQATAEAMRVLAERYPRDAEIAWHAGHALARSGRRDEARAAIRHARELDASFAAALWYEASLLRSSAPSEALRLLDECVRISPTAASCLRVRASMRASRGDCPGFETDARRMTEIEPRGPRAYEYLAAALAARGAPIDSVRAALDKRATLGLAGTVDSSPRLVAEADLWVALLTGDLVSAEAAALTLQRLVETDGSEAVHAVPALALVDIYDERGEPERARAVAETFVRRVPAWIANAPRGMRARLVAIERRAGRITEAKAYEERTRLLREAMELDADRDPLNASYQWLEIEAQYVASKSEAAAALERMPAGDAVIGFEGWARGKAELLGGRRREGIATLRAALESCTMMTMTDSAFARVPFTWMEAQLLLAGALEDEDRGAACDAYARVLDRWKDPKPRSVSVDRARSRAKARRCSQ